MLTKRVWQQFENAVFTYLVCREAKLVVNSNFKDGLGVLELHNGWTTQIAVRVVTVAKRQCVWAVMALVISGTVVQEPTDTATLFNRLVVNNTSRQYVATGQYALFHHVCQSQEQSRQIDRQYRCSKFQYGTGHPWYTTAGEFHPLSPGRLRGIGTLLTILIERLYTQVIIWCPMSRFEALHLRTLRPS